MTADTATNKASGAGVGWLALTQLFASVALTGLTADGLLPAGAAAVVTGIEGAVLPLVGSIREGKSKVQDTLAAFGAMIGVLRAASKQTGLSPQQLSNIESLETAVSDAILAFMSGRDGKPDLDALSVSVPMI